MGVPTVVLVTEPFAAVARASAAARGIADLPIVVFPAGLDDSGDDAVRAAFAERWPQMVEGLTRCSGA
jgi:hypothetical protein